MSQFLVLAYDGRDKDAPERRRLARPTHFVNIQPMVDRGQLRAAGAILNDAGTMIGSALFVEFESREQLDLWLKTEPYVTQGVWQKVEVMPFRIAVLDGKITQ
jgi:uncharacterized protein YciI